MLQEKLLNVRLEGVTKKYKLRNGEKIVLDDITFDFPKGRSIAILGLNGAGKSTLIRLMAGAEEPTAGTITRYVRLSWPLGFSGGLAGSMTGKENARFVARIYGQDVQEVEEFVRDFAEIGEHYNMPVKTYSSGMRARLAFGLSMAIDFDCYLVDEILSVGDAVFRKKCQDVFSSKLKNADIIMVAHSASILERYCDSAAILLNGRLIYFKDIKEAIKEYNAYIKSQSTPA
ncbi:ABC transporter ATP-binding protein [Thermopetrobacter sp. TC1]|uniref:ABC transporter ATP-binding protein n=1 Tax=Thermopetrobacter sp. TC1 TaxID=1495045 RepID=UPI000570237A|nr:ABC transporter ATP-binding protein [Thermopetrobacter sp. TC1]